ncbi:hypothetical protein [Streptomyces sp. NPDC000229]
MSARVGAGVPVLRLGDVLVTGLLSELDDEYAIACTGEPTEGVADAPPW